MSQWKVDILPFVSDFLINLSFNSAMKINAFFPRLILLLGIFLLSLCVASLYSLEYFSIINPKKDYPIF